METPDPVTPATKRQRIDPTATQKTEPPQVQLEHASRIASVVKSEDSVRAYCLEVDRLCDSITSRVVERMSKGCSL